MAVLALEAGHGADPSLANLVSQGVVQAVRDSRRLERVVSAQEIETILGFERQKQMVDCKSESCVAELAGSLGVDLLLSGSIGKLESTSVLTLKLVDVRKAIVMSSLVVRVPAVSNDALMDAVPGAVTKLLDEGGVQTRKDVGRVQTSQDRVSAPAKVKPRGMSFSKWGLAGLGGLMVSGGLLGGGVGMLGLVGGVVTEVLPYLVAIHVDGLKGQTRIAFLVGGPLVLMGGGLLVILASILAISVGVTTAGWGLLFKD